MGDTTSRITYILETAQAQANAKALSGDLDGIGKSAKSGAAQATAGLNATQASTKGAAVAGREAELIYQNIVRTQGAGSKAALDLAAAMGTGAAAAKAATPAVAAVAVATEAVAAGTGKAEQGFFRLTSMVNTGQGPLRGYDALVQAALRSFGGIPVAFAVAIPIVLALGQALFKLSSAKREQIEIDLEVIRLNLEIVTSMQTGTLFTQAYSRVIHDHIAARAAGLAVSDQIQAAEAKERAAIVAHSEAMTQDKATSVEAYFFKRLLGNTIEQGAAAEAEATAGRQKAEAALIKQIEADIKYAASQGHTRDQLLSTTAAIYGQGTAVQILTELLNQGALAAERFRQGQSVISRLRLDRRSQASLSTMRAC